MMKAKGDSLIDVFAPGQSPLLQGCREKGGRVRKAGTEVLLRPEGHDTRVFLVCLSYGRDGKNEEGRGTIDRLDGPLNLCERQAGRIPYVQLDV